MCPEEYHRRQDFIQCFLQFSDDGPQLPELCSKQIRLHLKEKILSTAKKSSQQKARIQQSSKATSKIFLSICVWIRDFINFSYVLSLHLSPPSYRDFLEQSAPELLDIGPSEFHRRTWIILDHFPANFIKETQEYLKAFFP